MTNDLRKQAEAKLALSPKPLAAPSPAETQRLLHELRVHQIELEMQNDELRQAQAEIEAGRVRYFDLYDLAPVGYVTVGEKGLVQEANLTAATLLGVSRDALVRQPLTRFILKEDQDLYYLLRKRLSEGSGAQAPSLQTCELRMLKPDGSFFWAQLDAIATEGPDGAPACRVVLSDISGRKQREAVSTFLARTGGMTADRTFFQTLAECLAQSLEMDFVCIDRLDGDGLNARTVAVYCDGHFEDNVTYALKDTPCGDVVGKTVCCFPAGVCQFFPRDIVLRELRAESYVGVTLFSHVGQPIGLIAVISRRSLTNRADAEAILQMVGQRAASELERLDIEAELQESDLRFRHLLQSVPNVAVQGYGADGTTLYWNDASEHLYGYTAQEALGRNLVELIIPPEMRDVVKQLIRQMAETGQQIPAAEVSLMRKDGSRVDVFSSHATVQIPGQPLALFCIDIDITERKAAEAQRAEAFVALQQEKDELKRWQSLTVGRELKMVELKKEVNTLLKQAGQPEAYKIVEGKIE